MSNAPRLAKNGAQDTTPSAELNALATIYHRAIERYEEVKAAGEDGGEEHTRKESEDVSHNRTTPQR
jgi:hypothetical protein